MGSVGRLITLLFMLIVTATACGPKTVAPRDETTAAEESIPQQATVIPMTGGIAISPDDVFSIQVPALMFAERVTMTVSEILETPQPDATLTKLYAVTYEPSSEQDANKLFRIQFDLAAASLQMSDEDTWQIAVLDEDSQVYSSYLTPIQEDLDSPLWKQVTHIGGFALVDQSLLSACVCDDSDECSTECACDQDCEPSEPDPEPTPEQCAEDQFTCGNGTCLETSRVCDTLPDCMDGSDELSCGPTGTDPTPTPTAEPDEYEPNDTASTATEITSGVTQTHSLTAGDRDYVVFTLAERMEINIETNGTSGDTRLYLYSGALSEIALNDDGGNGAFSKINAVLEAGTYYAMVTGYSTSSFIISYSIAFQANPPLAPAPENFEATLDGSDIVVTWTDSGEATGYNLYYGNYPGGPYTGSRTANEGASPISTTEPTLRLTGLQSGYTYYLIVKAVDADGAESYPSAETWARIPLETDTFEPDDDFATASSISNGETQERSIHAANDVDYVQFQVRQLSNVTIVTTGPSGDSQLYLYNSDQQELAYNDDGGDGFFSAIGPTDFPQGLEAGTYYLKMQSFFNGSSIPAYTMALTVDPIIIPDGPADEHEPDDTIEEATSLIANEAQSHSINRDEDQDYFTFTLDTKSDVVIETSGSSGDSILTLYDSEQSELATDDDSGDNHFAILTQVGLGAGQYFVVVTSKEGTGQIPQYTIDLSVTAYPSVPTNVQATWTDSQITVTWDATPNAAFYRVYYSIQDDPFSSLTAAEGTSPLSVESARATISGLPQDKEVYISVSAINGSIESALSAHLTVTAPSP